MEKVIDNMDFDFPTCGGYEAVICENGQVILTSESTLIDRRSGEVEVRQYQAEALSDLDKIIGEYCHEPVTVRDALLRPDCWGLLPYTVLRRTQGHIVR